MPTRTSKRTGEVQELVNGQWVTIVPPQEGVTIAPAPPDPSKVRAESREEERLRLAREAAERDARGEGRAERGEERSERGEARDITNDRFSHVTKLAGDYNADPSVKAYRVAISQLGQALQTGRGPQADLALTYAFAKAMDPESVVRESEQGMVTSSQPWFQAAVENVKKQFGMDNAGSFTPEAREALRRQIANSVAQRVKVYDARRDYYTK
ncbi:MAG TPA: hypothetical protein VD994_04140 [Prosthecobacter sp.]|nr:hypothetical protein [Prosthecobacter sp.]